MARAINFDVGERRLQKKLRVLSNCRLCRWAAQESGEKNIAKMLLPEIKRLEKEIKTLSRQLKG